MCNYLFILKYKNETETKPNTKIKANKIYCIYPITVDVHFVRRCKKIIQ